MEFKRLKLSDGPRKKELSRRSQELSRLVSGMSLREKAQERKLKRERTEKKLKIGRLEEPCPVGACIRKVGGAMPCRGLY